MKRRLLILVVFAVLLAAEALWLLPTQEHGASDSAARWAFAPVVLRLGGLGQDDALAGGFSAWHFLECQALSRGRRQEGATHFGKCDAPAEA